MSDEQRWDAWFTWPAWAKDAVVVDCDVHLSVGDALRVLWHRRLSVRAKTFTANVVGQASSVSHVSVPPWIRRPPPMVGQVERPTP